MKNTSIELNVDFIGGQATLTQAEESALSEYFKQKKIKNEILKIKRRNKVSKLKIEKV
jgi:hypothetical protein